MPAIPPAEPDNADGQAATVHAFLATPNSVGVFPLVELVRYGNALIFRHWKGGTMPGGEGGEDLASRAIQSLCVAPGTKGRRLLPDPRIVPIIATLRGIMQSFASHSWTSTENRICVELRTSTADEGGSEADGREIDAATCCREWFATQRGETGSEEEQEFLVEFHRYAEKQDPKAHALLLLARAIDTDKPAKLAEAANLNVAKIYNLKKRLLALARRFQQEKRDQELQGPGSGVRGPGSGREESSVGQDPGCGIGFEPRMNGLAKGQVDANIDH
jgi:hypothetical protein